MAEERRTNLGHTFCLRLTLSFRAALKMNQRMAISQAISYGLGNNIFMDGAIAAPAEASSLQTYSALA